MQREITNTYEQVKAARQERLSNSPQQQPAVLEELDLQSLELVGGGAAQPVDSPKNGW
jgi:hypothetical protein